MPEYIWRLTDLKQVASNGYKVFSCYSGGGGSTMGYRLAGYHVIGNVEMDQQMNQLYVHNQKPRYNFGLDIREFKTLPDYLLPKELYELDILDASPPCSSFSVAGTREKHWGQKKRFREGQQAQVIDDLFFDFLDVAEKLQPKVVIAENVKGLLVSKARGYVNLIIKRFGQIGYQVQIFLLNAATMGVPQRRERVFFIAHRYGLPYPKLKLEFQEKPIVYSQFKDEQYYPLHSQTIAYHRWKKRILSDQTMADTVWRTEQKLSQFTNPYWHDYQVVPTLTAGGSVYRYDVPGRPSDRDLMIVQTFPLDYEFLDASVQYVVGMSVPPVMMKKISQEVARQWLVHRS